MEYPAKIRALREALGLKKGQFASAAQVPHTLISLCEAGKRPPSVDFLVKLGNLAAAQKRYDDAVWFWGRAGIAIEGLMPAALGMLESVGAAIPKGSVTSVPPAKLWSGAGSRILVDSVLLRNPYSAKYILADDSVVLVIDEQELDLWKLVDSHVALLCSPVEPEIVETSIRHLSDAEILRYPAFKSQELRYPLHTGLLRAVKRGEDTVLTLEARDYIGPRLEIYGGEIVAVEFGRGPGGRGGKRAEVPYFTVLGRVIEWADVRGTPLVQREAEQRKAKTVKREQKKGRMKNENSRKGASQQ